MRIASHNFMNRGGDCKVVCKAATLVGVLICVLLFVVSTQVIVIHPPTIVRRKLSAGEIYPAMINNIKPLGVPIDHESETVTFWRKWHVLVYHHVILQFYTNTRFCDIFHHMYISSKI